MLAKLLNALRAPGAKKDVAGSAPTQHVLAPESKEAPLRNAANLADVTGYAIERKPRLLDRWLDRVVQASGSEIVFFVILSGILAWAFLGIPFNNDETWQVLISDVQAILSYIFDSLLMRQQMNSYDEALLAVAKLKSRALSHRRMLERIMLAVENGEELRPIEPMDCAYVEAELPRENWFGHLATSLSILVGHIGTIIVYWIGIVIWLAFGHSQGWSNQWQLYMNSATSALMVFVFAFLANIRERHSEYLKACLDANFRIDSLLERQLRLITGDQLENVVVVISAPKVNPLQRAIYYYADLVGTLVGIAILVVVMVVWVCIGPLMHFDSNWWLLIGTYAGLVGLNDGFVLRNVQAKLRDHETANYEDFGSLDSQLFDIIHEPVTQKQTVKIPLSSRISIAVGHVCAHELTVLLGVLLICGLLAGSSAMKWNTTGQLLCNVPPSIIESFFMIILITGHNFADAERRVQLRQLHDRRFKLLNFLRALENKQISSA